MNKDDIILQMENIMLQRLDISTKLTEIVTTINDYMGRSEDINYRYEQLLNDEQLQVMVLYGITAKLEELSYEIENFTENDKNSECFRYLQNNTSDYNDIINMNIGSYDKRNEGLQRLLKTYKTMTFSPYGEDMNEMVDLLNKEIELTQRIKEYNIKFISALKTIVNKVNGLN